MSASSLLLALALAQTPAEGPAAGAGASSPHVITHPDWLRKPTADDLLAVFPVDALRQGVNGRAMVRCAVTRNGGLFDCRVLSESPAGYRFGAAGLALTPQFLMKPRTVDGQPVDGGQVTIPLNFLAGGGASARIPEPAVSVLSHPLWSAAPSRADVAAVYPRAAASAGTGGVGVIRCRVTGGGTLRDCQTGAETPVNSGFAQAAKRLAGRFRIAPAPGQARVPADALVTVNVAFAPDLLAPGGAAAAPMLPHSPEWTEVPDAADALATFPATARAAAVMRGRARVRCVVGGDGRLTHCTPVDETPAGLGFGVAASALAARMRMSLWTADGTPTAGAIVVLPLSYDDPDAAPKAPTPAAGG